MATKPTFGLPIGGGPSASSGSLNQEINRVVGAAWDEQKRDADAIRSEIAATARALDRRVDHVIASGLIVGEWSAASGAFPIARPDGTRVQQGDTWRVAVAGSVDGQTFAVGDYIQAIRAGGGAAFQGNWAKAAVGEMDKLRAATISAADRAEIFGPRTFDGIAALQADTTLTASNTPVGRTVHVRGYGDMIRVSGGGDATTANGLRFALLSLTASLTFASTPDGGDNYDSTTRLVLESYQRPQAGPYGEILRALNKTPRAKTMIAWYHPSDPSLPWHEASNPMHTSADVWIGAHYAAQDDDVDIHGHWSLEVPDGSGHLRSRFGIDFIDQTTKERGVDRTHSYFANTDLSHAQGDGGVFRLHSGPGSAERIIEFNAYGNSGIASPGYIDPMLRRWHLAVDQAPEAGDNAGSNFILRKFADDGSPGGVVLYARRSTGDVTIGEMSVQSARLAVRWQGGAAGHGLFTSPNNIPAGGFAHWGARAAGENDRILDTRVGGDTNSRFRFNARGAIEWGDGSAAPDLALTRSGVSELSISGSLRVGPRVQISTTGDITFSNGSDPADVTLRRNSPDRLSTPNDFQIGKRLYLAATDGTGFAEFREQSAIPARPTSNGVRLYARDNGAGKTEVVALFESGPEIILATQP